MPEQHETHHADAAEPLVSADKTDTAVWWIKSLAVMAAMGGVLVLAVVLRYTVRKWYTLVRIGWRRWRKRATEESVVVAEGVDDDDEAPPDANFGGTLEGDPYKLA